MTPAEGGPTRREFLQAACLGGLGLALPFVAGCSPAPAESSDDGGGAGDGRSTTAMRTPFLPIDMPSRDEREAAAANRLVLGHFFPVFPTILDHLPPGDYWEDAWLPPGGTEGEVDHRPYGGLVRDRKWIGVGPVSGRIELGDRIANLRREISLAIEAGLDGFTVNLLTDLTSEAAPRTRVDELYAAARELADPYFRLVPMPDGTSGSTRTSEDCSRYVGELLSRPVPGWLIDGKPVIAPFAPEAAPEGSGTGGADAVRFWQAVMDRLESDGRPSQMWPCYVDTWSDQAQAASFDSLALGHGRWGEPVVAGYGDWRDTLGAVATSRENFRKPWMGFVMKQADRPKAGLTWDSHGTRALATQWQAWIAAGDDCPVVHLPTWDDFSEGTQIAPSRVSGPAWSDLTAVFVAWYKQGKQPEVVRDCLYLAHRRMIVGHPDNSFSSAQTQFPKLRGSAPQVNLVEVRVFARAAGILRIFIDGSLKGEFPVKPGMSSHDIPAEFGRPSAVLVRDDRSVASVNGAVTITAELESDDRLYHLASSLRQQV